MAEFPDAFWTAVADLNVWQNGQAAPPGRYRLKFQSISDLYKVSALVSAHGGQWSIRDGMASGPVLTFWRKQ